MNIEDLPRANELAKEIANAERDIARLTDSETFSLSLSRDPYNFGLPESVREEVRTLVLTRLSQKLNQLYDEMERL